jgi:hypothetical protein
MATVLYNKTTREIVGGPYVNGYLVDGMPGEIQLPFIELTIIENNPPEYNPLIQKLISEWEVKTFKKTRTLIWSVVDKTEQERIEDEDLADNQTDSHLDILLLKRLLKRLLDQLTDPEALEFMEAHCVFRAGRNYTTGERLLFKGNLYKVLTDHISERAAKPDSDSNRYLLISN